MWKPFQRAVKEVNPLSNITDIADFLQSIPEIKEAFTKADIELALDDRGWLNPTYNLYVDLDARTRRTLVSKARLYWYRDPLAKQAVRLWTDYALGQGITWKCDDASIQKQIDGFAHYRLNRRVMSSEGQRKSCKKQLIDGEVFFAIFDEAKQKVIRRIDPIQITDIITDPEDSERILGYRRDITNYNQQTGAPNITAAGQNKVFYYMDWTVADDQEAITMFEAQPGPLGETIKAETNVVVYHAAFDALDKRGNGLLSSVVDWSREHRRFMEARVAVQQALAKYAYKLNVKGGQGVVDQIIQKLASTYTQSGPTNVEKHPQNAPGGTWAQNAGLDLTPQPRGTGAGDARSDGDQLKLMVSAGTGIMLHYFGDPSTGNLATATAMELPMLKMFESHQQQWIDVYRDLFAIVLDEDIDAEPAVIDIDLPPILMDDLGKLSTGLTAIIAAYPELGECDEVLQMMLGSLGVNNISEVMKSLVKIREQQKLDKQANADKLAKLMGSPPQPGDRKAAGAPTPMPPAGLSKESAERLVVALERLSLR